MHVCIVQNSPSKFVLVFVKWISIHCTPDVHKFMHIHEHTHLWDIQTLGRVGETYVKKKT